MSEFVLVCGAALVAGFTQGLTGFGAVIVGLPIFTALLGIKTAAPLANLLSVGVSLYLCIRLRSVFRWDHIRLIMIGAVPGIPLGTWMLKAVPARSLEIALAVTLALFCLHSILGNRRRKKLGTPWAGLAGFTSGLLGGSIGAYGPPVVIYFSVRPTSVEVDKASMSVYFLLAGAGIAIFQAAGGLIDTDLLRLMGLTFPSMAIGAVLGAACHGCLNDRVYRMATLGLLLLMALLLFLKSP